MGLIHMRTKLISIGIILGALTSNVCAQQHALVNTSQSPYAKFYSPDADAVKWTGGFWGHWYDVSRDTMVMNMLHLYENDTLCHGFCNFEIAAGIKQGEHAGAPFHDGDFYKTLEAVVSLYAQSRRCAPVQ